MKKLLVIAGESSGDIHAANLVRELIKTDPDVRVFAAGGDRLREAGAVLLVDLVRHAVMGAVEVLKHYHEFKKIFKDLLAFVEKERPDAVLLIDYPGFNLKFAKAAKARGVKVIYYISPQIWAWAPGRIRHIKETVDQMIVILPFEKELYERAGVRVAYVGHPILDVLSEDPDSAAFSRENGIRNEDRIIGLLPGSRKDEIRKILPVMLDAAVILARDNPDVRFFTSAANEDLAAMIRAVAARYPLTVTLCGNPYALMKLSRVCMVASGTATVQTAFYLTPMVIIYKCALITWFLAKMLIKIPYIGLVNVIAGKKIIDEFIQFNARGQEIAARVQAILSDGAEARRITGELRTVKERLGKPGASARAAHVVVDFLKEVCEK
ncbi:MAG TPA: lipid-A-disaccharide synthase [bacterium]|nr:lipid-A-disaccharide synthase [bacterium]